MGDLLVKLYDLPDEGAAKERLTAQGIHLIRPLSADKGPICRWVKEHFSEGWSDEVSLAFSGQPVTCFIALNEVSDPVGFACYDATFRGFFGPTGVLESHRGQGIGTALLLRALHAMSEAGYAYAVIGFSGADEFYARTVGAVPIEGSSPGAYRDRVRRG